MKQPRRGRAAVVSFALLAALVAGGCTGDDGPAETSKEQGSATGEQEAAVPLVVRVGKVTGQLQRPRRQRVAAGVAQAVDRWFEAAHLGGDYPRRDFSDAFPGFTRDAARSARRDRALTTNARLGPHTDRVTVTAKRVTVELLSPRRRPVGATGRFLLRYDTAGRASYSVEVTGRLLLTRLDNGRWQVFGYDVARQATERKEARQ
jgi:hypothetical protein